LEPGEKREGKQKTVVNFGQESGGDEICKRGGKTPQKGNRVSKD